MIRLKKEYLCNALDRFKEMIIHDECSNTDINYFCDFSKYELDKRGVNVDKQEWIDKRKASQILEISTSTFDRMVLKGVLPRGRKMAGQNKLVWKSEQIEQLNRMRLLKVNR